MPTARKCSVPAHKLSLYDALIDGHPLITRKGAANPYTSHNGHMFSYLNEHGSLALRLPKQERDRFLEKYGTTLFEAYGIVMKEYVTVPESLLENTQELQPYLELSYQYICSLKPKPSKKGA